MLVDYIVNVHDYDNYNDQEKTKDKGFKFGDITKSVVKNVWAWFG